MGRKPFIIIHSLFYFFLNFLIKLRVIFNFVNFIYTNVTKHFFSSSMMVIIRKKKNRLTQLLLNEHINIVSSLNFVN